MPKGNVRIPRIPQGVVFETRQYISGCIQSVQRLLPLKNIEIYENVKYIDVKILNIR